ncbi:WXG100 family type VII secretion target [Actinokineospora guangxiensis]|uniref:WXG100 family type VII secretion target n=1 Tax=Actinokineospora guangxiensis TaxID=1490288 RepID=A0ABW0ESG0_9PSEU
MTSVEIQPDGLLAYSRGTTGTAENFGALAGLVEQARVSDECFGPIGEFLAMAYFNNLEECRDLAKQAGDYLDVVSQAITDTAAAYTGTDEGNAGNFDGLAEGMGGPGSIGSVNGAGDQAGYFEQHASYGSSLAKVAFSGDKLADPGSPPEATFALINARAEQLNWVTSPGQAFVDNGLGFLIGIVISPLIEFIVEPAVGDPEQMRSTGKGWEQVAQWVEGVAEHERARAEATGPVWSGEAGDAFRAEMSEFAEGVQALAGDLRNLKENLELAADLFDLFVETVIDILTELVIGLIIEWLAALAASWITFGASVGAATGLTTAQVAVTGTRLGTKVANLLHKLKPIFTKLEDILKALRSGPLRGVVQRMHKLGDAKVVGKVLKRNPAFKFLAGSDPGDIARLERRVDAVRDAQRNLDNATQAGDAARIADATNELATARRQMDNFVNQGTVSNQNVFGTTATGEQALAQRTVSTGLGYLGLGGTTDRGTAIFRGTLENLPMAAAENISETAYDRTANPRGSEDERRATQERGFTYGE